MIKISLGNLNFLNIIDGSFRISVLTILKEVEGSGFLHHLRL